jgi:hypothetical protein
MKKPVLLLAFLFLFQFTFAQDQLQLKYANTITTQDLHAYLSILASDSLEGRATGERGQKMAADYIKNHFQKIGLKPVMEKGGSPSYYQEFELEKSEWTEVYIKAGKKKNKFEHLKEFAYLSTTPFNQELTKDIIFAGKGSEKDYSHLDVNGKAVAFFVKDFSEVRTKTKIAKEKGATEFFVIFGNEKNDFYEIVQKYWHYFSQPKMGLPAQESETPALFMISHQMAADIFNAKMDKLYKSMEKNKLSIVNGRKNKGSQISYRAQKSVSKVLTENVLGLVEGSDKKDEVIVITAHYDHIGIEDGKIYNGADDDGSGTSAVMELAEAFALAKKDGHGPRRSILFMAVTAEEVGLLGSEYYSLNPVFPLENTITNLNIDMIGRVDEKYENNPDYIYLIGADKLSQDLHDINENANATYTNLELDYTYNDENDPNRYYYRSDHYNFAKNGIPVIFYFNGTHEDYHQHTDTIEKINFEKMEKISRLIFHTTWELANREERIKVNK